MSEDIQKTTYDFQIFFKTSLERTLPEEVSEKSPQDDGSIVGDVAFERDRNDHKLFKVSITMDQSSNLEILLSKAFFAFVSVGLIQPEDGLQLNNCRLRQYHEGVDRMGETYGTRTTEPLNSLELSLGLIYFILETRKETDPQFTEHNPREMTVKLVSWDDVLVSSGIEFSDGTLKFISSAESADSATTTLSSICPFTTVCVPGEDKATVKNLLEQVCTTFGVSPSNVNLILHNDRRTKALSDENQLLRKDCGVWPGDDVVFEIKSEGSSSDSVAFAALKSTRQSIVLLYNVPIEDSSVEPAYDLQLSLCIDDPLLAAKEAIAAAIGQSAGSFHLRRGLGGLQLKDESKTLGEYGLADKSVLHVQSGKGCGVGEVILCLELDASAWPEVCTELLARAHATAADKDGAGDEEVGGIAGSGKSSKLQALEFMSMGAITVHEKWNVLQLKEFIFENWAQIASSFPVPIPTTPSSLHHLRLRDGKAGQQSLLRNDRVLNRCLLGLADNRRILVQLLDQPEMISADDVLLSVRLLSYEGKSLSRPLDLPVSRASTVQSLYAMCLDQFYPQLKGSAPSDGDSSVPEEARIIEIAKAFNTGPPLTLKTASKLKFNDPASLSEWTSSLNNPPLSLRDGSMIVVRGRIDYEKAKAAMKAKKESEEGPSAAGGGVAAVKARGGGGSAALRAVSSQGRRVMSASGKRPGDVEIEVFDGGKNKQKEQLVPDPSTKPPTSPNPKPVPNSNPDHPPPSPAV